VLVADVRAMANWLPENFELAGGGLACVGLGEDVSTYLASSLLDPSAKAQQPEHTDFSPTLWDWDADGVKGTAARMEQLSVHALLVQLYVPSLVGEGEIPPPPGAKGFGGAGRATSATSEEVRPPVWLGKDYQLQRQAAEPGAASNAASGWQRVAIGACSLRWLGLWPHRWSGWSRCWWGKKRLQRAGLLSIEKAQKWTFLNCPL